MNVKPKIIKDCKICHKEMALCPFIAKRKTLCSKECNLIDIRGRENMLGKHHSVKTRKKMSLERKGKASWNKGMKGYRAGLGTRPNIMPKGELHWSWKGGKSRGKHNLATSEYKVFRNSVMKRDGFICRMKNSDCKGQLQVHHILRWADFPELRYEINNGITLCHAHHPRARAEEKRLTPYFKELVSVSNALQF